MALSAYAIEQHVARPHNIGPIENASYGVSGVPHDGPWVEIWLRIEGEQITDAAYRTPGCPSSIAVSSLLCDLLRGRTLEMARKIEPEDLITILGGLPPGKGKYAEMALNAMRQAIEEN